MLFVTSFSLLLLEILLFELVLVFWLSINCGIDAEFENVDGYGSGEGGAFAASRLFGVFSWSDFNGTGYLLCFGLLSSVSDSLDFLEREGNGLLNDLLDESWSLFNDIGVEPLIF